MDRPPRGRKRTTIIAEIGENHSGDWGLARRMVQAAAQAGADAVKFQSYRADSVSEQDPEKEWFARVQLPDELHFELLKLAKQNEVEFLSSPFTVERARFLMERLGLRSVKIASSELLNRPLLEYVNSRVQTVYLSTGMATLEEIKEAVGWLDQAPEVIVMHCVSQYPVRDEDANVKAIELLREVFPSHSIGYSDHTVGTLAAVIAVALGASVIEKHFTIDKSLPGTDHILSADPQELQEMVQRIRQVETLLGTARKQPTPRELELLDLVRGRFPKDGS